MSVLLDSAVLPGFDLAALSLALPLASGLFGGVLTDWDLLLPGKPLARAVVIPVNTMGVMGAGMAKQAAVLCPALVGVYREQLASGALQPGKPTLVRARRAVDRDFILFPTKVDWREPSTMELLSSGLYHLRHRASAWGFDHELDIAFPPLGCGLGGLDLQEVLSFMAQELVMFPCSTFISLGPR